MLHHVSIRTADIFKSMAFYEQLGFRVSDRFTAGYTLACWMERPGARLELIQIPEPKPAPDAFHDEHYVGYYHLSFDIAADGMFDGDEPLRSLPDWLAAFQARLADIGQQANVLLEPQQQQIGDRLYEVAFLADPDGLAIEFLRAIG
jgi:catechol 2,3-dioxygenase-like lactoylglutathione lyase family enzyme